MVDLVICKQCIPPILDVHSVERKGKKQKLVLAEDGTVYKVKRSKLVKTVQAGQFI